MQLEPKHIEHINDLFQQMTTRKDLLELINYAKECIYGKKSKPFRLKTLTYYAFHAKNGYKIFEIKKKSGGTRIIHAPTKGLKHIQRALNVIFQCVFTPNVAAMGFVSDKSIVDNARVHQGAFYVYNIDLKDFFPSVDLHRIKACFKIAPFNLEGDKEPLAFLLANLCCTPMEVEREEGKKEERAVLPQGAPTSPTITNIVCQRLDRKLKGLAKRFGAHYTRYADDITFSSMHSIYQKDGDFLKELHRIIEKENFRINPKKTRLQKNGYRKEVTGLVVNEKVNVNRRYVKQIRRWLFLWEKHGYDAAQTAFIQEYLSDKGHTKKAEAKLENVLAGKLNFLRMVRGVEDKVYQKYKDKYLHLVAILLETTPQKSKTNQKDLDSILNTLVNEGLDKAMNSID